jgi:arylsulfatase A-like enzyme
MYANPDYKGRTFLSTRYGPAEGFYTSEEIEHIKAHYCGLVSLVDNWFGLFIDKLKRLGLLENSLIIFLSDHGTNFTDNPEGIIGKPHYSLYPGVMHIPLIVRFPEGVGSGQRFDELVYNLDATATIYDCADVDMDVLNIDGQSLKTLVCDGHWEKREYLTCRYGSTVWYRDHDHWVIIDVNSEPRAAFDMREDPDCKNSILSDADDVVKKAWEWILQDAGGQLPVYGARKKTDAVGRK